MNNLYCGLLTFSDNAYKYQYICKIEEVDGEECIALYTPEHLPRYDNITYRIELSMPRDSVFSIYNGPEAIIDFNQYETVAVEPFRVNQHTYSNKIVLKQCVDPRFANLQKIPFISVHKFLNMGEFKDERYVHVSLYPTKNGIRDLDYNTGSCVLYPSSNMGTLFTLRKEGDMMWVKHHSLKDTDSARGCQKLIGEMGSKGDFLVTYILADNERIYKEVPAKIVDMQDGVWFEMMPISSLFDSEEVWVDPTTIPPNLKIQGIVSWTMGYGEEASVINYLTNPIIVDKNILNYLYRTIKPEFTYENIIDNMNITTTFINDITKVEVTKINKANSDSAHVVQPIFIRTRELESLVIHPRVQENICINLDSYKSSCKGFRLKVENVVFKEIARIESGIVFGIDGARLPGIAMEGIYYILDDDGALITTGKYNYEV